jgi:hypothetical protein
MRFLFALLCMGTVVMVAAVVVVIDVLMKLLPLLICALLVVIAVRYLERRRRPGLATVTPSSAVIDAPRPTGFASPNPGTLNTMRNHLASSGHRYADVCSPSLADGWVMVPVWRGSGLHQQQHNIIDAEVISEDDHRG